MTADKERRRWARVLLLIGAAALAFGFLVGPGVNVAQADTATPEQQACPINTFIESDGTTVDLTAYAACVAAFDASQTSGLPRTGTDVGKYVGLGLGLIGLGAAFVWGSRRREHALS